MTILGLLISMSVSYADNYNGRLYDLKRNKIARANLVKGVPIFFGKPKTTINSHKITETSPINSSMYINACINAGSKAIAKLQKGALKNKKKTVKNIHSPNDISGIHYYCVISGNKASVTLIGTYSN